MSNHIVKAYQSLPVSFTHGDGCYLWDDEGKRYLDALSGISVTSLGHNFPALTAALREQVGLLLHTSNLYNIGWQQKLADLLCESAGMDRVFFANSGAEANEAAIKLARLYGHQQGVDNPQIVVMQQAFHGRTMATLSATGSRKVQAGFEPLVAGFVRAPFNDIASIEAIAANNRNVVAILVEPVQGEAGIVIPDPGYLQSLRRICDHNGWLLMLDEIQTGMARSGKLFACQHESVSADVITLAKALGNGVPIGACLTRAVAADVIKPGNHGSTFGGNPLACAIARTAIRVLKEEKMIENASEMGDYFLAGLKTIQSPHIKEVRGRGLMIAMELFPETGGARPFCYKLADRGMLCKETHENTIRFAPPLVIKKEEVDWALKQIDAVMKA
jgi:acetylornithine aminotransferase